MAYKGVVECWEMRRRKKKRKTKGRSEKVAFAVCQSRRSQEQRRRGVTAIDVGRRSVSRAKREEKKDALLLVETSTAHQRCQRDSGASFAVSEHPSPSSAPTALLPTLMRSLPVLIAQSPDLGRLMTREAFRRRGKSTHGFIGRRR
jgi:hypothetical protein